MIPELQRQFFDTAVERYRISMRRERGDLRDNWTSDPIFQTWRFCNVHREDDKTTQWFREHIRQHLNGMDALEATLIFRWFNRITTGERILDLIVMDGKLVPGWDMDVCLERLDGVHPVITGAYMVATPGGYTKLEGVLNCIELELDMLPEMDFFTKHKQHWSLEHTWGQLKKLPWIGGFVAYEIVSDLRWCEPLCFATDIMTWANAGPGCARGLTWLTGETFHRGRDEDQAEMNRLMQELLVMSQDAAYWPSDWKKWEMREVEHWLCEFDKYKRAESGLKLKRRYK